ncbi:hypothetical protein IHW47_001769 [Salmonella enterica]|uniref:Uncharacterized protein n=1 Tax=Salmonella newport TaxID=108619 RepID=A0A8E7JLN2_SALNE|nr:hypothetical protein [Salmonella enterica]QVX82472.1 hypothetical protein AA317_04670 [Salmonella enterica subsp. enterica serovar Newport]EEP7542984.1 hypothetical protein [Salmonella enterica]EFQ7006405.1 hypothetical protein [Salmonella enterica]EFV3850625.1 hypothetical protein [Salmonella enterica]
MINTVYLSLKKVFNNEVLVDCFFEKELSYLDCKHIAALSALVFVEDKINANKLKTYSDIVARLSLDDFAFALVCLYEMYEDNDIAFPIQRKKEVMLSILQALVDNNNSGFDEYRRRATHAISGAYRFDRNLVKGNGRIWPLYGVWYKDSILAL